MAYDTVYEYRGDCFVLKISRSQKVRFNVLRESSKKKPHLQRKYYDKTARFKVIRKKRNNNNNSGLFPKYSNENTIAVHDKSKDDKSRLFRKLIFRTIYFLGPTFATWSDYGLQINIQLFACYLDIFFWTSYSVSYLYVPIYRTHVPAAVIPKTVDLARFVDIRPINRCKLSSLQRV